MRPASIEIIGRLYTTNAGKDVHARVRKGDQPDVTEIRTWAAHEHVSVKRSGAKGINRSARMTEVHQELLTAAIERAPAELGFWGRRGA
jgi:hypothetical protein